MVIGSEMIKVSFMGENRKKSHATASVTTLIPQKFDPSPNNAFPLVKLISTYLIFQKFASERVFSERYGDAKIFFNFGCPKGEGDRMPQFCYNVEYLILSPAA